MSNTLRALALLVTCCALVACTKHEEGIAIETPASAQAQAERPPAQQPAAQRPPVSASQVAEAIERLPEPDRSFVRQAAAANVAAIRFGELAANRGTTVEIRSLGREMVDTHTGLSDQLRTSARTEGITLPLAQMTPRQQRMLDELSTLSGREFDEAFKRDVVKLQREAIANFQHEAVHGKLSELAMLANQMLPLLNQRVRTVQNQLRRM
jgi:putative membrane protein